MDEHLSPRVAAGKTRARGKQQRDGEETVDGRLCQGGTTSQEVSCVFIDLRVDVTQRGREPLVFAGYTSSCSMSIY